MPLPDLKDWTRGPDGKFVDWTQPPYRNGSLLCLRLEGEKLDGVPHETYRRRIMEYYALIRRQIMEASQRRTR